MPFLLFLSVQIFWQAPTLDSVALAAFREKDLHRALFFAELAQAVAPAPERRRRLCVLGVASRKTTYLEVCPETARELWEDLWEKGPPAALGWANRLIPGSGLMLMGAWKEGLVSLTLNALVGYGIWRLARERRWVDAGLVFLFFGPRFYGGSQVRFREAYRFRLVSRALNRPVPGVSGEPP